LSNILPYINAYYNCQRKNLSVAPPVEVKTIFSRSVHPVATLNQAIVRVGLERPTSHIFGMSVLVEPGLYE
jgi:hypothetical protein